MSSSAISSRIAQQVVRPVISTTSVDARRRVLKLYKAWYRQIPFVRLEYDLNISQKRLEEKMREQFEKNRHLTDIRVIDLLVVKGQQELVETAKIWKQKNHIMNYFKETETKKSEDFLTNFYDGHH
ncbi:NADH dehydrogenase [ubiquinone] 1 alpha subcomplex subunit 6-like [Watersipora subatra]|uniref:NADH dehydrogenase [ubiquinone] 1 alpha subcomplex subunit 6-like n=1 Tax=Watersipora subatra TaxID=2589382 RepID=UPI00355B0E52